LQIQDGDYVKLARILREARGAAGLTQQELADKLSVPQSFVSKYETGERRLDLLELRQIAVALNTSPVELAKRIESALGGAE